MEEFTKTPMESSHAESLHNSSSRDELPLDEQQSNSRNLMGRLGTLEPLRFLRRHNPLRRPQQTMLGFDQPRDEIQKLAIPMREAPSLGRRVRMRAIQLWCKSAVLTGRVSVRVERAVAPLQPFVQRAKAAIADIASRSWQRVTAIQETAFGRWCTARMQATVAMAQPEWSPMQAPLLMTRVQRIRQVLMTMAVGQWAVLVGLAATSAVFAMSRHTHPWDTRAINAMGIILCVMGLAGLVLHTWYQRLIATWRSFDLFICGHCGHLRNFSPSLPCSNCDHDDAPVFPSQVPSHWTRWNVVISAPALAIPPMLTALVLFLSRLG
ncbi:MAG: hypothetical protein FWC56_00455 [Phycisphaerae bacterium]|nr:hypothetical protein [Phycisphaerae bacterium]